MISTFSTAFVNYTSFGLVIVAVAFACCGLHCAEIRMQEEERARVKFNNRWDGLLDHLLDSLSKNMSDSDSD